MDKMDFHYERFEHNVLYNLLKIDDISSALAYMVDFSNQNNFTIIPHKHSIQVSNKNINIVVVIFAGFEDEEYRILQFKNNLQLVTFSYILPAMIEFRELNIKFIDNISLLFTVLSRSQDDYGKNLNRLKNLIA